MKSLHLRALFLALVGLIPSTLMAGPITFDYEAEISSVSSTGTVTPITNPFMVGMTVVGSFSYDPDAAFIPISSTVSYYDNTAALAVEVNVTAASVSSGGVPLQTNEVLVTDQSSFEQINAIGIYATSTVFTWNPSYVALLLNNTTAPFDFLSSSTLPQDLSLNGLETKELEFIATKSGTITDRAGFTATITSLTKRTPGQSVPDSGSTILLMLVALLGMLAFHSRKHSAATNAGQ